MNKFFTAALCSLFALGFVACSNDEDDTQNPPVDPVVGTNGALIINQGNYYNGIAGSLDFLAPDGGYSASIFAGANQGMSLGDTPEGAVVYGQNIYIPVYASNLLWVIDKDTYVIRKKIETREPEAVCAGNGHVYVTNNDGYLTSVDTLSLAVDASVAVGPNPVGCTYHDGKIYAAISDGYNYTNNYANGKKVAVVDAASYSVEHIAVGLNPSSITVYDNRLFVSCLGNYADVLPEIWEIRLSNKQASRFCDGYATVATDEGLVIWNSVTDWSTYSTTNEFSIYTPEKGQSSLLLSETPVAPIAMAYNPAQHYLYITSDAALYDYNSPGYLYTYDLKGQFLNRYETGVHPYAVAFK